jgi:hypothetical protein
LLRKLALLAVGIASLAFADAININTNRNGVAANNPDTSGWIVFSTPGTVNGRPSGVTPGSAAIAVVTNSSAPYVTPGPNSGWISAGADFSTLFANQNGSGQWPNAGDYVYRNAFSIVNISTILSFQLSADNSVVFQIFQCASGSGTNCTLGSSVFSFSYSTGSGPNGPTTFLGLSPTQQVTLGLGNYVAIATVTNSPAQDPSTGNPALPTSTLFATPTGFLLTNMTSQDVPEPSTVAFMVLGGLAIAAAKLRRKA